MYKTSVLGIGQPTDLWVMEIQMMYLYRFLPEGTFPTHIFKWKENRLTVSLYKIKRQDLQLLR